MAKTFNWGAGASGGGPVGLRGASCGNRSSITSFCGASLGGDKLKHQALITAIPIKI